MVKAGPMKPTNHRVRQPRTTVAERAAFLEAFKGSGLSGAAFAREHGIHATTFANWQRQAHPPTGPAFVEVELPAGDAPDGLVIELGPACRLRITDAGQVELAACLLKAFHAPTPC